MKTINLGWGALFWMRLRLLRLNREVPMHVAQGQGTISEIPCSAVSLRADLCCAGGRDLRSGRHAPKEKTRLLVRETDDSKREGATK